MNRQVTSHLLSRHGRDHTHRFDSSHGDPAKAAAVQLSLKSSYYIGTVSKGMLVGVRHCTTTLEDVYQREKLSCCRGAVEPDVYPGFRLSSELLNYTRHWHCVLAVKQTFHRRSRHHCRRRWIRCRCRRSTLRCWYLRCLLVTFPFPLVC